MVMFATITLLLPKLAPLGVTYKWLGSAIALVASAGVYHFLANVLSSILGRVRWLREKLYGEMYLEGTWVGYFKGHGGDIRLFVERYKQSLIALNIQGNSYTEQGAPHANWTSETAHFDSERGVLHYFSQTNILSRKGPEESVCRLNVQPDPNGGPPCSMEGYAADLVDGNRVGIRQIKASSYDLAWQAAIAEARALAENDGALP